MQTGDHAYRLTAVASNPVMLKQIFDRLFGRAREALEVEFPAMPSTSDTDLAASLTVLLVYCPVSIDRNLASALATIAIHPSASRQLAQFGLTGRSGFNSEDVSRA